MVGGLLRDQSSHLFASVAGWAFVMDRGTHMTQIVAETVVNMTRDTKKQPKPILFGWPWDKPEQKFEQVSTAEMKQYQQQLRSRSAFAQLRG